MLRGERDQPNPYVPIFVDDHPNDRAEIGQERSTLRATLLGFCYAHLAFFAGNVLLGAFFGATEPLRPIGLLFGVEGMKAAFFTVIVGYVYILAAVLVSAFGIINGIIVNYWQSYRPWAFFLWCSIINLLVFTCLTLASR